MKAFESKAELIPMTKELKAIFAYRKYKNNLEEENRAEERK